jgi:hypothetical protein
MPPIVLKLKGTNVFSFSIHAQTILTVLLPLALPISYCEFFFIHYTRPQVRVQNFRIAHTRLISCCIIMPVGVEF